MTDFQGFEFEKIVYKQSVYVCKLCCKQVFTKLFAGAQGPAPFANTLQTVCKLGYELLL